MSPELMYLKFLQKINKNSTQFNIACDRGRFVLLINEQKDKWQESNLKDKDSILIDALRETIKNVKLLNPQIKDNYVEYPLDFDFYEHILCKNVCQKEECKGIVYSREVKNQNKNILEFDENQRPDFDYEWTFNTVQGGVLRVYKRDFDILETDLEYYARIPAFDMAGYINIEGNASQDAPITILSDQYIDQIISFAAKEFMMDYESQAGIAIATERINS